MLTKFKIAIIMTSKLFIFLMSTKKLEYQQMIIKLKASNLKCINTSGDAVFAFRYISFLSRKLKLNNSCFIVSSLLFECSPRGAKIHFALDSKKNAHSWFELEGMSYTTDKFFTAEP